MINVIGAQPVSARIESLSDGERSRQRKVLHEAQALLGEWEVAHDSASPRSETRRARSGRPPKRAALGVIVVGRGSGLRRLIDGSVSARLVRRAPCDVLVVH